MLVTVKVTPTYNTGILVNVYEGRLSDSLLVDSYTTSERARTYKVVVNRTYTFTATYLYQDYAIVAVDEVTPTVRLDESSCDNPCYWVINDEVNLRNHY